MTEIARRAEELRDGSPWIVAAVYGGPLSNLSYEYLFIPVRLKPVRI